MIKKKGHLVLITMFAIILLILSQCTGTKPLDPDAESHNASGGKNGNSTEEDDRSQTGTLNIAVAMEPGPFAALQRLSTAYANSHGGQKIQLTNLPVKEAYGTFKKASQLGEPADVMLVDNTWVNEFAALGYLQPVDEWYTTEMQQQRLTIVQNQVKWNGYLWGIPFDVDPYILAWNKSTAAAAKWEHEPETPEELTAWRQSMTKPEEGRYGVYFDPELAEPFITLVSALTGTWLDPAQTDKKWLDPEIVKTVGTFLYLTEPAKDAKALSRLLPQVSEQFDPWDQLQKGKIAAMITTFSAFRNHSAAGLSIASMPHTFTNSDDKYVWLKGRSFVLSSRSVNRQAAMDWIKEMTSLDSAIKLWNDAKLLPTLIPALSLSPIRGDQYSKSYEWLLNHAIVLQSHPETAKRIASLQMELQRLIKGEQDMKSFADQMAKLWVPSKKP